MSDTPERDKFMSWYDDQRANHGLKDISIFTGELTAVTVEDIFQAMNKITQAVADGKYTIMEDQ